jgi:hypothetical protein
MLGARLQKSFRRRGFLRREVAWRSRRALDCVINASQKKENEFDMHRRRCDLPLQILTAAPLLQAAGTQKQDPSRALDDSLVATTPP